MSTEIARTIPPFLKSLSWRRILQVIITWRTDSPGGRRHRIPFWPPAGVRGDGRLDREGSADSIFQDRDGLRFPDIFRPPHSFPVACRAARAVRESLGPGARYARLAAAAAGPRRASPDVPRRLPDSTEAARWPAPEGRRSVTRSPACMQSPHHRFG